MTVVLISLSLLILVSGYFFISDYFNIFKKASDQETPKASAPVNEAPSVKSSNKQKKVKTEKEKANKVEVAKSSKKMATKISKKDSLKTPEAQTLKAKRGRKKKS